MERRNRSIEALNKLKYVDSLDDELKALSLEKWVEEYLTEYFVEELVLEKEELSIFLELFYKNINFLKNQKNNLRESLNHYKKIKKFFK